MVEDLNLQKLSSFFQLLRQIDIQLACNRIPEMESKRYFFGVRKSHPSFVLILLRLFILKGFGTWLLT